MSRDQSKSIFGSRMMPTWLGIHHKIMSIIMSHNSSSVFSSDAFASVRKKLKSRLKFSSGNAEVYYRSLSMGELRDTLRRSLDTSAGLDEIHYQVT